MTNTPSTRPRPDPFSTAGKPLTTSFAMGVEAATVQRILRHSSISVTTGTYVEVIEQVQHEAMAGMNSLLRRSAGDDSRTG